MGNGKGKPRLSTRSGNGYGGPPHAQIESCCDRHVTGLHRAEYAENIANAVHVFDHFHVIKLFNDKLSDFRRHLFHQLKRFRGKSCSSGIRWLPS